MQVLSGYSSLAKIPASVDDLYQASVKKLEVPIALAGSHQFWFDSFSELKMRDTIRRLESSGGTVAWRHSGGESLYTASGLSDLMESLLDARGKRGLKIDREYLALRDRAVAGTLTQRDLQQWLKE